MVAASLDGHHPACQTASVPEIRRDASFIDAKGVTIHYSVWNRTEPRGVIQLLHGLGEHRLRYQQLAEVLVAAGYSVWADDHRGHGATGMEQWGGDRAKLGKLGPGGMRATIGAVRQFGEIVREANPRVPFILLGHSWGSLLAQILFNMQPAAYDAVVLSGTAYRTLRDMNGGDLNARHRALGDPDYEWLSRDPSVVAAAAKDPLMFVANGLKLFGLPDTLRLLGRPRRGLAAAGDTPVLLQLGSDDSFGGEASVAKLANAYVQRSGLSDVTAIVYPGARHEIYNETNRQEVYADLIAWLTERFRG